LKMIAFPFLACLLLAIVPAIRSTNPLGPYKVSDITTSGVSSGGYMAVQLHIAYSSIVNGSATFAAGPFYCAEGSVTFAENKCMDTSLGLPNVEGLVALTLSDEAFGYIDSTHHLKDDRIYLFSGSGDSVVLPAVVHSLQTYYEHFIPTNNIVADYSVAAEHCWPTIGYGESCDTLSSPYMGKCGFDSAAKVLKTFYGEKAINPPVPAVAANLMQFNQKTYWPNAFSSLADNGYIYVPKSCQQGAVCHLHIAFHGCLQTQNLIGTVFAQYTGLNEYAEANNVIVLYPYATTSSINPINPNGCWDWWGYTEPVFYGVKLGKQMQFIRSLMKAITGN